MNDEQLSDRLHFYYCAIVALRIFEQRGQLTFTAQNSFLLKWLHNAQRKKIFPAAVFSEISWLRGIISEQGMHKNLLSMLNHVYQQGSALYAMPIAIQRRPGAHNPAAETTVNKA